MWSIIKCCEEAQIETCIHNLEEWSNSHSIDQRQCLLTRFMHALPNEKRHSIYLEMQEFCPHINFQRISGQQITSLVEPLELVEHAFLFEAYRFHANQWTFKQAGIQPRALYKSWKYKQRPLQDGFLEYLTQSCHIAGPHPNAYATGAITLSTNMESATTAMLAGVLELHENPIFHEELCLSQDKWIQIDTGGDFSFHPDYIILCHKGPESHRVSGTWRFLASVDATSWDILADVSTLTTAVRGAPEGCSEAALLFCTLNHSKGLKMWRYFRVLNLSQASCLHVSGIEFYGTSFLLPEE